MTPSFSSKSRIYHRLLNKGNSVSLQFEHTTLGQRVVFGSGQVVENVANEVERFAATRIMLIASTRDKVLATRLSTIAAVALRWHDVRQHVPLENAERARTAAIEADIDLLIAFGGGSTIGLAKAIALTTGLPIIAIPTTFSGSEATDMWGITENGTKRTGHHIKVLPAAVVYDAELTSSLPMSLAITSGLNGLAHSVDSLWAPDADPINQSLALEGARVLNEALRGMSADSSDLVAREKAMYGGYLAAVSFASAGSGLHHKICHVLGGTFDLPHAPTHAIILPYVLALNAPAVPELAARLATALGGDGHAKDPALAAVAALNDLRASVNAPGQLVNERFTEIDVPEATHRIVAIAPTSNPVKITAENVTMLLADVLSGTIPTSPYRSAPQPTN